MSYISFRWKPFLISYCIFSFELEFLLIKRYLDSHQLNTFPWQLFREVLPSSDGVKYYCGREITANIRWSAESLLYEQTYFVSPLYLRLLHVNTFVKSFRLIFERFTLNNPKPFTSAPLLIKITQSYFITCKKVYIRNGLQVTFWSLFNLTHCRCRYSPWLN